MNWTRVNLITAPENLECLSALLIAEGIDEFSILDPQEFSEYLQTSVYYDYVEDKLLEQKDVILSIYAPKNGQGAEKTAKIQQIARKAEKAGVSLRLETASLKEEDWMNNWKQYFKPTNVGEKILIKPSWEALPEGNRRIVLEIDPSSSFGTGTHETTRLCIEALEKLVQPGAEVLDMGYGSGILSVAALLLGAGCVTAVDIEEDSIRVSRENALRNGIAEDRLRLFLGNVLLQEGIAAQIGDRQYDVIAANIVADVIKAMIPLFFRFLRPEGKMVCSGIILERAGEVRDALEDGGLEVLKLQEDGEWAAVIAQKRI